MTLAPLPQNPAQIQKIADHLKDRRRILPHETKELGLPWSVASALNSLEDFAGDPKAYSRFSREEVGAIVDQYGQKGIDFLKALQERSESPYQKMSLFQDRFSKQKKQLYTVDLLHPSALIALIQKDPQVLAKRGEIQILDRLWSLKPFLSSQDQDWLKAAASAYSSQRGLPPLDLSQKILDAAAQAHVQLVQKLAAQAQWQEAEAAWSRAEKEGLDLQPQQLNIAKIAKDFEAQAKPELALAAYDFALKLNPAGTEWRSLLLYPKAKLLIALKRGDEAIRIFDDEIRNADPKKKPTHLYIQKAGLLEELGRFDEALGCYNLAIEKDPNSEILYAYKAEFLLGQKRFEEAAQAYEAAWRHMTADPWGGAYLPFSEKMTELIPQGQVFIDLGKRFHEEWFQKAPTQAWSFYRNFLVDAKVSPQELKAFYERTIPILEQLSRSQKSEDAQKLLNSARQELKDLK